MRGQPFVRYVLGLTAGILLYVYAPATHVLPIIALLVGALLLVGGSFRRSGRSWQTATGIGALLLLLALGWGITYQHTASNRPDAIAHLRDTLQAYEGVVSTQPEERAKTYRVELDLRRGRWRNQWQPLSGRVIVYLDKAGSIAPRYGEVWVVAGAPRPIDPPLNPGEFDYKRYLSYRSIYHQQYLRSFQRQIIGLDPPFWLTSQAVAVNQWADSTFRRQVGSRTEYGIINAMILGVRDDLDPELYRAYSTAGAVHILSVSGLHVGILFLVLTSLLGLFTARGDRLWWVAVFKLVILWFYALITGMSPPVLRSAAMFSVLILAKALGRRQQLVNTMAASTFFILCFDPYALFSAGFQLSNLAVAGIGAWQSRLNQALTFRHSWLNKLWAITAVALVAQLVTFPLGVFYFHQFPTYFLLANPLVMGLSFVLLPLAMATLVFSWVPFLNELLGWLLQKIAWLLNDVVSQTGRLPGAAWDGLWLSPTAMLLTYAVILAAVMLLLTRKRAYAWVTCLAALLLASLTGWDAFDQLHQRRLAVHFLPHRTAVSLTDGQTSTLLTDLDSADTRSYDFYLKNTFGQWGVRSLNRINVRADASPSLPAYHQSRDWTLWVWRGKTVLLVNRLAGYGAVRWRLPAVVDYLIIRRNALHNWRQLDGRVVARHIIFDDSSKTPLTDRLLAEAREQGITCHSVRQMGAYVAEL